MPRKPPTTNKPRVKKTKSENEEKEKRLSVSLEPAGYPPRGILPVLSSPENATTARSSALVAAREEKKKPMKKRMTIQQRGGGGTSGGTSCRAVESRLAVESNRVTRAHRGRFFVEMDELEYFSREEMKSEENSFPDDELDGGGSTDGGSSSGSATVPMFVESAHWIRGLEQDVVYDEKGKEHFTSPKAGSSTLHGFFSLKRHLAKGVVLLDLDESDPSRIAAVIVAAVLERKLVDEAQEGELTTTLLAHHHHAASKERHAMLVNRRHRRARALKRLQSVEARGGRAASSSGAGTGARGGLMRLPSFGVRTGGATTSRSAEAAARREADEEKESVVSESELLNDPDPDGIDHDDDGTWEERCFAYTYVPLSCNLSS